MSSRPTGIRLVLDTNVVLSALLFRNGRLRWVRRAWQSGQIIPVVCRETVNELLHMLAYPIRASCSVRPETRASTVDSAVRTLSRITRQDHLL